MANVAPGKEEIDPNYHPTRASHGQEMDTTIRKHGFQIHSRPKGGKAVWTRNGQIYTESEVWDIVSDEEASRKA